MVEKRNRSVEQSKRDRLFPSQGLRKVANKVFRGESDEAREERKAIQNKVKEYWALHGPIPGIKESERKKMRVNIFIELPPNEQEKIKNHKLMQEALEKELGIRGIGVNTLPRQKPNTHNNKRKENQGVKHAKEVLVFDDGYDKIYSIRD